MGVNFTDLLQIPARELQYAGTLRLSVVIQVTSAVCDNGPQNEVTALSALPDFELS